MKYKGLMTNMAMGLAISRRQAWSAVGSMALCVAMLIASEFMPVSLLTPIATDLHATDGMAGQAISVSGLFAVATSLFIATIAGRFDRRYVLLGLTGLMLASLILIAEAPNFAILKRTIWGQVSCLSKVGRSVYPSDLKVIDLFLSTVPLVNGPVR